MIHSWQVNEKLVFQNTFFYFAGDGNFQQFKIRRLVPGVRARAHFRAPRANSSTPPIWCARREVDEWDGGWIPNLEWRHGRRRRILQAGAAIRLHSGRHFGVVQWAQYYPPDLAARPPLLRLPARQDDACSRFVQENWRFNDRWNLLAGLTWTSQRYDMHDDRINDVAFDVGYSYLLPRLGLAYHPTPRWSLYANVSRGGREPAFRDIYDPQSYWTPPPQDLDPEELTDFELGAGYRWTTGERHPQLLLSSTSRTPSSGPAASTTTATR